MGRLPALALVGLLAAGMVGSAAAQTEIGTLAQYQEGNFAVRGFVKEGTTVKCAAIQEVKQKNQVEVSVGCRELAGVPAGREVTLVAELVEFKQTDRRGRFKTIRECTDSAKSVGDEGRILLSCTLNLPRDAR